MTRTKGILIIVLTAALIGAVAFGVSFWLRGRSGERSGSQKDGSSGSSSSAAGDRGAVGFVSVQGEAPSLDLVAPVLPDDERGGTPLSQEEREDAERLYAIVVSGEPSRPAAPSVSVNPSAGSGTGDANVAAPRLEGAADDDRDGLTNDQELQAGTDVKNPDTDGDELSDADELQKHRTDPKRFDTDADGLTDGEEVSRYRTDPLQKDTDGDGYTDGTEVQGGYNPSGAGKLP